MGREVGALRAESPARRCLLAWGRARRTRWGGAASTSAKFWEGAREESSGRARGADWGEEGVDGRAIRHVGHRWLSPSHSRRHRSWKACPQGMSISLARPSRRASRHTAQLSSSSWEASRTLSDSTASREAGWGRCSCWASSRERAARSSRLVPRCGPSRVKRRGTWNQPSTPRPSPLREPTASTCRPGALWGSNSKRSIMKCEQNGTKSGSLVANLESEGRPSGGKWLLRGSGGRHSSGGSDITMQLLARGRFVSTVRRVLCVVPRDLALHRPPSPGRTALGRRVDGWGEEEMVVR